MPYPINQINSTDSRGLSWPGLGRGLRGPFSATTLQRKHRPQPWRRSSLDMGWTWVTQLQDLRGARQRWRMDLVGGEGDADPRDLGVSGEDGEFSTSTDLEGRLGCLRTLWLVLGGRGWRVAPGEGQTLRVRLWAAPGTPRPHKRAQGSQGRRAFLTRLDLPAGVWLSPLPPHIFREFQRTCPRP